MLKGPKCNLNFSFLHTLGQGEGRKKSHVQRKLGKHLAHPTTEKRTGAWEDRSRLPASAVDSCPPWPRTAHDFETGPALGGGTGLGNPLRKAASSHASNGLSDQKPNEQLPGQGPGCCPIPSATFLLPRGRPRERGGRRGGRDCRRRQSPGMELGVHCKTAKGMSPSLHPAPAFGGDDSPEGFHPVFLGKAHLRSRTGLRPSATMGPPPTPDHFPGGHSCPPPPRLQLIPGGWGWGESFSPGPWHVGGSPGMRQQVPRAGLGTPRLPQARAGWTPRLLLILFGPPHTHRARKKGKGISIGKCSMESDSSHMASNYKVAGTRGRAVERLASCAPQFP